VVVALGATVTAMVWYFVEPIVVTYDSFAYLTAAKYIAGVEGGSFSYFRPPAPAISLGRNRHPANAPVPLNFGGTSMERRRS
jgi:hypothetical protein